MTLIVVCPNVVLCVVLVLVDGADPAGSDAAARDEAAAAPEDGGSPSPTGEGRKGSMTEERH